MLHGRSLSLSRTAVRWTLYCLLLAGSAGVVDQFMPPEPRWITHRQRSEIVGFSPDGRTLAAVRGDGLLQLLDPANGQEVAGFFADADVVRPLGFVPCYDNTLLVAVQYRKREIQELHLVDGTGLTSHKLACELMPCRQLRACFSARSSVAAIYQADLLFRNERWSLVDLDTGEVRLEQDRAIHSVTLNGQIMFFASQIEGKYRGIFWDVTNQHDEIVTEPVHEIQVSNDKRTVVTTTWLGDGQQRLTLWDIASAKPVAEVVTDWGGPTLSDDGFWAQVGRRKTASFWNLRQGRKIGPWPTGESNFRVIYLDDEPRLLTFANSQEYRLRDAQTLETSWQKSGYPDLFASPATGTRPLITWPAEGNDLEVLDLA
jgi:WD40 repeat protein